VRRRVSDADRPALLAFLLANDQLPSGLGGAELKTQRNDCAVDRRLVLERRFRDEFQPLVLQPVKLQCPRVPIDNKQFASSHAGVEIELLTSPVALTDNLDGEIRSVKPVRVAILSGGFVQKNGDVRATELCVQPVDRSVMLTPTKVSPRAQSSIIASRTLASLKEILRCSLFG
jgi:hypothetical protein